MTAFSFARAMIVPSLHPEEPQSGVTKGEGTERAAALRDADLRSAPRGEERARAIILRDAFGASAEGSSG